MFKKSYKGRRIKLAAKKSLAVLVAIVTSLLSFWQYHCLH